MKVERRRERNSAASKMQINERGEKIVARFGHVAVFGVEHPALLIALQDATEYWKDTFRPSLTAFCCEAVGGKAEIADEAGLMFSLAAAGTGIHDDIIDKQSKKRFRMTILGNHGLEIALLAGDLLIIKAWSMLKEIARKTSNPAKLIEIIEKYESLLVKICEAEVMEMSCRLRLETSLESHQRILESLNADLEACAGVGAILGDGSKFEVEILSRVGKRLGLMLGLKDDAMDSRNLTGNLVHRLIHESVPLPLLFAAQSSKNRGSRIESILRQQHISKGEIQELVETCFGSGAFSYVLELAKQNAQSATQDLLELKQTSARDALELIIEDSLRSVARLCTKDFSPPRL